MLLFRHVKPTSASVELMLDYRLMYFRGKWCKKICVSVDAHLYLLESREEHVIVTRAYGWALWQSWALFKLLTVGFKIERLHTYIAKEGYKNKKISQLTIKVLYRASCVLASNIPM